MRQTLLLISCFMLILVSCSEELLLDTIENKLALNEPSTRTVGDGLYSALGYGYDITDEYLGENSTKLNILDVSAFIKDNPNRYDNPFVGIIDQKVFAGGNAETFLKQLITDTNFSGSVAQMGKKDTAGFFSATVTTGFKSNTKYLYSSKYSFAKAEVVKKQRKYLLNSDIQTLSNYLSSSFIEDLNKYSPSKIVEMYGTHVLTNIIVGGTYSACYKSAIIEENSHAEKTKTVSAGAKFNLTKVGLDANGSWSKTEIAEQNKRNSNWECNIKCLGGSTSGTSYAITSEQGTTITINLGAWTESVDDNHSRLVDVDWNATYPIYDLIKDPIKKSELKAAVEKYIDSKKIEILPIVPLYQYWDNKDHFYMTGYSPSGVEGRWKYEYPICYVLERQVDGSSPLHQYWNGKDHFYMTGYEPSGFYNWKYDYVSCYVPGAEMEGTVPLYQYLHKGGDHYYSTYYSPGGIEGWKYDYICTYVFPLK